MAGSMPSEALTHDWNKYRDTVVAVAGVDRVIRTFDIRFPTHGPLTTLAGHHYAIKKVTWSPHLPDLLLSAGYDMTCRVWSDASTTTPEPGVDSGTFSTGSPQPGRQLGVFDAHTEFVLGLDWCLFGREGWCASCGWDEQVYVWDVRGVMG